MRISITILVVSFLVSMGVGANPKQTNTTNKATNTKHTKINYSTLAEQRLAQTTTKFFDISEAEYARAKIYKAIVSEMDKNNTLSTLEILGIYAQTQAEKRKYARKFAKAYYQHTDRVITFNKLVDQEKKSLYGNLLMFDYATKTKAAKQNLRSVRVINLNNCNKLCEEDVNILIKRALITPVDLYFKNGNSRDINQWALKMKIDPAIVKNGHITLNYAQ